MPLRTLRKPDPIKVYRTVMLNASIGYPLVRKLGHLSLEQPDDPQNRSPPLDLTDQQTTLF